MPAAIINIINTTIIATINNNTIINHTVTFTNRRALASPSAWWPSPSRPRGPQRLPRAPQRPERLARLPP
eukprot:542193-Pyramimonas_sp.AAC.1